MKYFSLMAICFVMAACAKPEANVGAPGALYTKTDLTKLQSCSANVPCTNAGETCVSYGGTPVCYAQGRENEIVGCTSGSLAYMESYPAKAFCH